MQIAKAAAVCLRKTPTLLTNLLSIAALVVCVQYSALAQQAQVKTESVKATRLKEVLDKERLSLVESIKGDDRLFCDAVYRALSTAGKAIQYVEPVLRTDNPDHPDLARYQACRNYQGERGLDTFSGLWVLGTHSFRLYRLQTDGNSKDKVLEYLYGEQPETSLQHFPAQYARIRFGDCSIVDQVVVDTEIGGSPYFRNGINALVRYRGRHFIYTYSDISLKLRAQARGDDSFVFTNQMCLWQKEFKPLQEPKRLGANNQTSHFSEANIFARLPLN